MASTGSKHAEESRPEKSVVSRIVVRVLAGIVVFGLLVAGAVVILSNVGSSAGGDDSAAGPVAPRPTCEAHTLRVTADPAIADAVLAATADLSEFAADQGCLAVEVDTRPSADVAAELSRPPGVGLGTALPDAWLPDSSVWLDVAGRTEAGAARLTQTPQSIASSPLVVAVDQQKAEDAGWPEQQPTWKSMLKAPPSEWQLAIPDPQLSTPGVAALLAVRQNSAQFANLGRRLELPSTKETSPAQLVADDAFDAMPTAEFDVARVASAGGDVVASYDPALDGALDFPLIGITPDQGPVSDQVAADLELLKTALSAPQTQAALTSTGLRGADGALGAEYADVDGEPTAGVLSAKAATPFKAGADKVTKTLQTWSLVGRRSRLLILLDVSGSMEETLPGGQVRKIDLARRSLSRLVESSAPDSDLGLWTFTTGQGPDGTDPVVDVGPLGEEVADGQTRRDQLTEVVDELEPVTDGGTPLYRAVLAAYSSALDDFAFGRYNAVVVVTDGRDEDETQNPIPANVMLDRLRQQYDGMRPVEIISLAYGDEVDAEVLRQMADVTGGTAYQGLTQKQVKKMLREALEGS
jgi:Ca-activated chloride channel homolog